MRDADVDAPVVALVDADPANDADATAEVEADVDVDVFVEPMGCPLPTVTDPVALPVLPIESSELAVTTGRDERALAWVSDVSGTEEVFFVVVSSDGTSQGSPLQVSPDDGIASWAPSVEPTSEGYAVAYADARGEQPLAYLRVVVNGILSEETQLPEVETYDDHWSVDLALSPEGMGAAWHDGHDVFFAAINDDGTRAGDVVQVTNDPWILEPLEISYGAGAFSIVWMDARNDDDVLYGRVTRSGEKLVAPLPIASAPGVSFSPSLCFDGVSFIFLWIDEREGSDRLTLARLDPDGTILDGPTTVAQDHAPDRARVYCTGLDYGVAWLEGGSLFFGSLNEDFELIEPEVMVSAPDAIVDSFALVWAGEDYEVATISTTEGSSDPSGIALTSIACSP